MAERVAEVGYINADEEHALISIFEPPLLNATTSQWKDRTSVQVALSIDTARLLASNLQAFLEAHDGK